MATPVGVLRNAISYVMRTPKMYGFSDEAAEYTGQAASDVIRQELSADKPSMICRYGSNELNCVIGYCNPPSLKNYIKYFKSEISSVGWSKNDRKNIANNAGFFPPTPDHLARFATLMIDDMKYIDILGTCIKQELYFSEELKHVKKIPMKDMEPFHHDDPWTDVLKYKRVLVIHPFEETIRSQFAKRKLLFERSEIFPEFDLVTIKAVQSVGNNNAGFNTWFDALEYMKSRIDHCSFDIAILGCGAYGVPLAAHIKRIGKKAFHMGGATQLLFGIKGARWEQWPFYQKMFNEHWIKPLPVDCPETYRKVENGCYW